MKTPRKKGGSLTSSPPFPGHRVYISDAEMLKIAAA
jgi:hypothetical protein